MNGELVPQDAAKQAAGRAAVERYARDGALLGLGSGTTSAWFVRALGAAVADGLDVVGVPTSTSTRDLAQSLGIRLADLNDLDRPLDVTIDGPDEVDAEGDMIKGGGACLLWERIVAASSRRMVCIADDTKSVDRLGRFPLPVEVIPFGWRSTERTILELLDELGYHDVPTVRRTRDSQVVITDSGNYILDLHLRAITDKSALDTRLNWIPGVVENGLFTGVAAELIMASPDGTVRITEFPAGRSPGRMGQT